MSRRPNGPTHRRIHGRRPTAKDLRTKGLAAWEHSPRFEDFQSRSEESHTRALNRRDLKALKGTPKRILRKHGIDPELVSRA